MRAYQGIKHGLADEKTDVQVLFFGHRRLRFCVHGQAGDCRLDGRVERRAETVAGDAGEEDFGQDSGASYTAPDCASITACMKTLAASMLAAASCGECVDVVPSCNIRPAVTRSKIAMASRFVSSSMNIWSVPLLVFRSGN